MAVISDSAFSLEEALAGKEIPHGVRNHLALASVTYYSFDGLMHEGQLVVHELLVPEIKTIFNELFEMEFPILQVRPIVAYAWDDNASMAANNTAAFNYRTIAGTDRLSNHSYGLAIDINPLQNPYLQHDGAIVPPGAVYDPAQPGTITAPVAERFISRGWEWGGNWERKDWQHFQKKV